MKTKSTRKLTGLLGDIRRTNNFVITIENVTEDDNNLDLVIQQAFLPKVSITPIELRHGNEAIKLAGAVNWEGGTLTILDVLSRAELDAIEKWHKSTYDFETGQVGFADTVTLPNGDIIPGYKRLATITEYAGDGKFARKWEIRGVWINNFDPGTLHAAQAEGKEIGLTLQIDPSPVFPVEYGAEYGE